MWKKLSCSDFNGKDEKEDISEEEKKELRKFVSQLKREARKNG